MATTYRGIVEIIADGAVIETARAELLMSPSSQEGRNSWGGTLEPSGGRLRFNGAFLNLHGVFAIRLRNGHEAQVVKRTTRTSPGTFQHTKIEQANGGSSPF